MILNPPPGVILPQPIYLDNFGDSLSSGYGANYWPYGNYLQRLAMLLGGVPTNLYGGGVGAVGQWAPAWSLPLQDYSGTGIKNDVFPYRAWPAGQRIVSIGYGFNDLNGGGTPAYGGPAAIPAFLQSMQAQISRALAGYVDSGNLLTLNGPGGVGAGLWAKQTTTLQNSGAFYWSTTEANDTFAFILRQITPGCVYNIGGPVASGTSGTISLYLDGVTFLQTVNLANAAPLAPGNYGVWNARITNLFSLIPYAADQTHTIVGVVNPVGGPATINYLQLESACPGPVLVKNIVRPNNNTAYWAASQAQRDADIANANGQLKGLCASFAPANGNPNPVLFSDVDSIINRAAGYYSNTVTNTGAPLNDGLHLNDAGYAAIAAAHYSALIARQNALNAANFALNAS